MKWYVLLVAALGVATLMGCSRADTEDIDGGVRHYEDENAPKVIESTQIVTFSCEISTYSMSMNSSPVAGRYYTFYAGQEGGSFEARAGGEVFTEKEFTPDAAFFEALQEIVAEHDLAQYNGKHYSVSGLPPDYGAKLDIRYESGESIRSSDNQSCFIPVEVTQKLVELFENA